MLVSHKGVFGKWENGKKRAVIADSKIFLCTIGLFLWELEEIAEGKAGFTQKLKKRFLGRTDFRGVEQLAGIM